MDSKQDSINKMSDEHRAELAEEVRAYLVVMRGGAPFLSSTDTHLLSDWLDRGIPVAGILASIDRVARQRAQKVARSYLTLAACKAEVKKSFGERPKPIPTKSRGAKPPSQPHTLQDVLHNLTTTQIPPEFSSARDQLIAELTALATADAHAESTQLAFSAACRRFHEGIWEAAQPQLDTLRAAAVAELAALEAVTSPRLFEALIEEKIRQTLRAQVAHVDPSPLWQTLLPGTTS